MLGRPLLTVSSGSDPLVLKERNIRFEYLLIVIIGLFIISPQLSYLIQFLHFECEKTVRLLLPPISFLYPH